MKRIIIAAGAALLAAVPVTIGLVGNTSFAQSIPVRVPSQATSTTEPGNDNGGQHATPSGTSTTEPGDDNGGQHATPSGTSTTEPGDDNGGESGSGKDDNGGHGGDNSGTSGKDDGPGHS